MNRHPIAKYIPTKYQGTYLDWKKSTEDAFVNEMNEGTVLPFDPLYTIDTMVSLALNADNSIKIVANKMGDTIKLMKTLVNNHTDDNQTDNQTDNKSVVKSCN